MLVNKEGLVYKNIGDNTIEIDTNSEFKQSRIILNGNNNKIFLGNAKFQKLVINLKGNNKIITIDSSVKNIHNLKITSIRGNDQNIIINKNFGCGGCEIQMNDGNENLFIGEDCLFSWGIKIRTSDGHSIVNLETGSAINLPENVSIGTHVWVGEDVKFLKGARVPDNCIIASFAVVTRSLDNNATNTVIGGFPAKILKKNVTWDRRMPYEYNKVNDGKD